jgi:hypothetical protein
MKTLLSILFLILSKSLISQDLIPDAVKIKSAYELLLADTSNKKLQESFVAAFPLNTRSFLDVFQAKNFDQLYNVSHKYLELFEKCAAEYPQKVLGKCVNIGRYLIWNGDAVGQLQNICVSLSVEYPRVFLYDYQTLSIKDQNGLISFYADVENFDAYPEFQELIDKLNSIGQSAISRKLENARTKRIKSYDH